jgi:DNA-binding NarL/FixJ family response regulator
MLHVLIKDEYVIYRKGIAGLIRELFPLSHIVESATLEELSGLITQNDWSLIIADVKEMNGAVMDFLQYYRKSFKGIPLLVMTESLNPLLHSGLLLAGAAACLNKSCTGREFRSTLEKILGNYFLLSRL